MGSIGCKMFVLVVGFLMDAAAVVAPLFFSLPKFFASSIAGTAFVAFALGPVYGGLFALATNILFHYATGGDGPVGYVLAARVIEAIVIGWSGGWKRGWRVPAVTSSLLILAMPPLTLALAYWGGNYGTEQGFFEWFGEEYAAFIGNRAIDVVQKYVFSICLAYALCRMWGWYRRDRSVAPSV